MTIYSVFSLLGGLAFFLFGMNVLSGSLEKVAGGKLETSLRKLTSNVYMSLFLGVAITVALQSSSALTVMLVGLVNSGIIILSQTIFVIFGANVGKTATSWLLSLNSIQTDNFFISLLKPANFSPIMAFVGAFMMMACKSQKKKNLGTVLIGFALLMHGMGMMSDSMSPLAKMPEFTNVLTAFNNPIIGVLIGAVFTGIIQSSAASVGVLQALSLTGSITFGMAIPIIMGENIGTCVTSLLSSIGVKRDAKRVAIVHISFNIIGTVVCLVIYFMLRYFVQLTIFDKPISIIAIAIFHTSFNIFTTCILLPFNKVLLKIAYAVVKDEGAEKEAEKEVLFDERLLLSPGLAISQARSKVKEMSRLASANINRTLENLESFSKKKSEEIKKAESTLDYLEDEIGSFLIKLSSKEVNAVEGNTIFEMLHCINDFERIGDHAINLNKIAKELKEKELNFSDYALDDFKVLHGALSEILDMTVECFAKDDENKAGEIEPLEQVIDGITREMKDRHIKRLQAGKCSAELGIYLTDIISNCERVSDHCSNIAVCIIQSKTSSFETHGYLNELKSSNSEAFTAKYEAYNRKYRLSDEFMS